MKMGMRKMTVTITSEMKRLMSEAEKILHECSQADMIRMLIITGLEARKEKAESWKKELKKEG